MSRGEIFRKIESQRIKLAIGPRVHNGVMDDITVTRRWTKQPSKGGSIPCRQKKFSVLKKVQIASNLLFNEEWELFLGSKAAGA